MRPIEIRRDAQSSHSNVRRFVAVAAFASFLAALAAEAAEPPAIDYQAHIAPIFTKYCAGCHNDADLEGGLSLESFSSLQEGGNEGVALLPGQSASSRMIRMLTGELEPKMPPDENPSPSAEEIELLRTWIDSGAAGPDGEQLQPELIVPYVAPQKDVHKPITALALSPDGNKLAVGHFQQIEMISGLFRATAQSIEEMPGKVNSLSFSADGTKIIAASGTPGLRGTALIFDAGTGEKTAEFTGHRDTLYDAVLSPDGNLLATCSYDHEIILWDVATGEPLRTLSGHNGPVFDLALSPDGSVLASASGDETIKLWRVRDGLRLDTLSQPQGEQYAVAFSPDGRLVVGGGADNRVRVWQLVSREEPKINPLLFARFAHEGAVTDLAFSRDGRTLVSAAEDRTLKAWQTETFTEAQLFEEQPDVVAALALSPDGRSLVVGRMDGSWVTYDVPAAPALEQTTSSGNGSVDGQSTSGGEAGATDRPMGELAEAEPNDAPAEAMPLEVPAKVAGVIHVTGDGDAGRSEDADLFRFHSAAGGEWMIEITAQRQKSPLDSFVEVLDAQGNSIERVLLQSVRDSYFTFRGKDSFTSDDFRVHNWEEMRLNQYLYASGEVVKLWHYPRGPDSGFLVYPAEGKRYTYFDTTALAHALGEPCYIVEPHPPGTKLISNGLPTFTIYYENDDDSRRAWGADSRLTFVAPQDGEYLVRVTDARGFGGADFKYELTVRPREPDFRVHLASRELKVSPGTGAEFRVTADRRDGYEGPIEVAIAGLPDGFTATSPLVIQDGQIAAYGTISAEVSAEPPSAEQINQIRIDATARIEGRTLEHEVEPFTKLELGEAPQLLVQVLPVHEDEVHSGNLLIEELEGAPPAPETGTGAEAAGDPLELTVAPGETIAARVRLIRRGYDGEVLLGGFDAGRNLAHGVYVDNIGLNGLTVLTDQTERVFFITADDWVGEQTRTFHLKSSSPGNPTSAPVILHVRHKDSRRIAGKTK